MSGFGDVLKNMSIGFALAQEKTWIHTAGKITTVKEIWKNVAPQNIFL